MSRYKWIVSYRVGVFVLFPGTSSVVTRLWVDERVSLPVFMTVGALLIAGVFAVIIAGTYLVSLGSLLLLDGAAFFPRLW